MRCSWITQCVEGFLLVSVLPVFSQLVHNQEILKDTARLNDEPAFTPRFMSGEHAWIGNQVTLKYPNNSTLGSQFDFTIQRIKLSFGDIVALAGDYFIDYGTLKCVPSISDSWHSSPSQSIEVAIKNVNAQTAKVQKAVENGQDVAQAYKATKYDLIFAACTDGGYALLNLCNFDHFGKDAERAYSAVHTYALRQAIAAHTSQSESDLKEAYFIEAFGQHFLTDSFAAGHIRTPRRTLHNPKLNKDLYGADRCSRSQHDEDCANGLWVTNREGQSWAAYGDKQLDQGRSAKHKQMVREASQAGVDEIWSAFTTGDSPTPSEFTALQKTPFKDRSSGPTNFVPLFELNPADPTTFLYRLNIDQRASTGLRQSYSVQLSDGDWTRIYKQITNSGSSENMYVYTKAFASDQQILHLGEFNPTTPQVVANMYGTVDAGNYGQFWSMSSQGIITIAQELTKSVDWIDAQSLGDGHVSLSGRQYTSGATTNAIHIGLSVSQTSKGQLLSNVTWFETVDDGNSGFTAGETLYGAFDKDSQDMMMVKFFSGPETTSKLEFWSLPSKLGGPPSKLNSLDNMNKLKYVNANNVLGPEQFIRLLTWDSFLLSAKIDPKDSFSTVVGYSSGPLPSSTGKWYFCSWQSNYTQQVFSTVEEAVAGPAQAVLSDPLSGRILRIFYGRAFPSSQTLQIDILRHKRDASSGNISLDEQSTQQFRITWDARIRGAGLTEPDYLLWFLHDLNNDGISDLVAYLSDNSNTNIGVLVFPGQMDGTFKAPEISPIKIDERVGTRVTVEFMTPLYTTQTTYTYPTRDKSTAGAIMSFFDNYGIIATRILAPMAPGSFAYELKGQDSAISGQRSLTLYTRPNSWMGLNRRPRRVGIIPL